MTVAVEKKSQYKIEKQKDLDQLQKQIIFYAPSQLNEDQQKQDQREL
jgi:hypothetical protein